MDDLSEEKAYKVRSSAGRPDTNIDWEFVGKMLEAGADGAEVAAYYGVHPNTVYETCKKVNHCNFSDLLREKRKKGDFGLRAKQYQVAMEGDRSMLIWLGKNRLKQTEKSELNLQGKNLQIFQDDSKPNTDSERDQEASEPEMDD